MLCVCSKKLPIGRTKFCSNYCHLVFLTSYSGEEYKEAVKRYQKKKLVQFAKSKV